MKTTEFLVTTCFVCLRAHMPNVCPAHSDVLYLLKNDERLLIISHVKATVINVLLFLLMDYCNYVTVAHVEY